MRTRTIITAGTVGMTLVALAAAVPADAVMAREPQVSDPIVEGLAGPLQIDVNKNGIAVGQSFALTVSKIRANGSVKNLVTEAGNPNIADVAGVQLNKSGVAYTYSNFKRQVMKLKWVTNGGDKSTIADLGTYEASANPDQVNTYGFRNLSPYCEDDLPEDFGPAQYTGLVDSHPYAIAKAPGGGWYIAEAAGNDILKVSRSGNVRAVAVLKPQPTVITQEAADNNNLPDCTVGKTYLFEPVPTDVEVASNGQLIVSLLPGGPEDESLGARGKVVRVNPNTGASHDLASGFAAATNVAIGGAGQVFVTNLNGDSISKVDLGSTEHYVDVTQPAALEWYKGKLYVGNNVFGNGSLVTVQ